MDISLPVWVSQPLPPRRSVPPRQSFESTDRGDVPLVPLNLRITPEVSGVDGRRFTAHSPRSEN